jgi:hypothetical protein
VADEEREEDPDVRFSYANERTFLAWNRTSLTRMRGSSASAGNLAFAVLVEGGGVGGQAAAPIAARFLSAVP